ELSKTHFYPALESAYTAPRNETEQILAAIWQRLLGVERVSVNDSFFELGGHSLLAIQLVSRIRDALLVDLTMRDLFESPTISDLGILILQKQVAGADAETLAQMLVSDLQALIAELPPEKRGLLTYKLRMLNAKSGESSTAKITRFRRGA